MKNILQFLSTFIIYFVCVFQLKAQSFSPSNIPRSARYDDVSFVNNNIGYTSVRGFIYKSTDGGNNWTYISKLDTSSTFRTYSRSVDFIDEDTGFVGTLTVNTFKGGIFKTTDKGLTWKKVFEVSDLGEGVCGMDHYENMLVGVGTYAGPANLYISHDYGATFITKDLSSLASALVDCYIVNKDTFFITGSSDTATHERPLILKTTDGGNSFQVVSMLNAVGGYVWKIYFRPDGNGLASVENNFNDPSLYGYVLRTTDFGATWQEHVVDTVGNFGGIILLDNDVAFTTEQHQYGMWKSTDGGVNWTKLAFSEDTTKAGNRMLLLDNGKIVIAGAYIYTSGSTTVGIQQQHSNIADYHTIKVTPNLVGKNVNEIKVELDAKVSTFGVFEIYNLNGQVIYKDEVQTYDKGKHYLYIGVQNYSKGMYYAVWKTSEVFVQTKFVVQ
ncbi:MAG: hypothetical protein R2739_08385 [Chitinophagales bacterium]